MTSRSDETMDASAFLAITSAHLAPVAHTTVTTIARTGEAYPNEIRAMARELLALRERLGPRPFWETTR